MNRRLMARWYENTYEAAFGHRRNRSRYGQMVVDPGRIGTAESAGPSRTG